MDLNTLGDRIVAREGDRTVDDTGKGSRLRLDLQGFGECEDRAYDGIQTIGLADDELGGSLRFLGGAGLGDALSGRTDHAEGVTHLVRDGGGELSEGGELIGLGDTVVSGIDFQRLSVELLLRLPFAIAGAHQGGAQSAEGSERDSEIESEHPISVGAISFESKA